LQGKETVLFSYDQRKPGAGVIWQCLGDPNVSDKHAFVGEGDRMCTRRTILR